jgi:hypothetical protein
MLLVLRNCFIEYSYTYNNRDLIKSVVTSDNISFKQLAKKYGYAHYSKIADYIRIYKNREEILKCTPGSIVSFKKAKKILHELKQQEKRGSWKA